MYVCSMYDYVLYVVWYYRWSMSYYMLFVCRLSFKELSDHLQLHCVRRVVHCQDCHQKLQYRYLEKVYDYEWLTINIRHWLVLYRKIVSLMYLFIYCSMYLCMYLFIVCIDKWLYVFIYIFKDVCIYYWIDGWMDGYMLFYLC